jgi:hypothetical protein
MMEEEAAVEAAAAADMRHRLAAYDRCMQAEVAHARAAQEDAAAAARDRAAARYAADRFAAAFDDEDDNIYTTDDDNEFSSDEAPRGGPTQDELDTKLLQAAEDGKAFLCVNLIRLKANVDVQYTRRHRRWPGEYGDSPLSLSVCNNHPATAMVLVEAKANVSPELETDDNGVPLLHFAAKHGNVPFCRMLVEQRGVDIRHANRDKMTALHYAAFYEQPAACTYLLNAKADADAKTVNGKTALVYAVQHAWDGVTPEGDAIRNWLKDRAAAAAFACCTQHARYSNTKNSNNSSNNEQQQCWCWANSMLFDANLVDEIVAFVTPR